MRVFTVILNYLSFKSLVRAIRKAVETIRKNQEGRCPKANEDTETLCVC